MRTTHVGGHDVTRQQVLIVNSKTLLCITNTHALLYTVEALAQAKASVKSQLGSSLSLGKSYLLHRAKSFEDDMGISAVAVDRDHELIAICGRSIGKPAGKFPFIGPDAGHAVCGLTENEGNLEKGPASDDKSTIGRGASDITPSPQYTDEKGPQEVPRVVVDAKDIPADTTEKDELLDPVKVPLLAVVGWEGDDGETSSLSTSYITLWNVSDGTIFLRLRAPALQVLALEWSPFFAYQITASGLRHVYVWTATRTFTGLKLKGKMFHFRHLAVSDVSCFVELTGSLLMSGSDSGSLLLWENGYIMAELLQLLPASTNLNAQDSDVAREQSEGGQWQCGFAVAWRTGVKAICSQRAKCRDSFHDPVVIANGEEGKCASSDSSNAQLVSCHKGMVNSLFRDPKNTDHIVSAGTDGCIKWWAAHTVLNAVEAMGQNTTISISALRAFTMPGNLPIKSILADRASSELFWVVVDGRGTTWLFSPTSENLVKVFDFHAGSILAPIEVATGKTDAGMKNEYALVTVGSDGSIRSWGGAPCRMALTCRRWLCRIRCVALMPSVEGTTSSLVFMGFEDGVVRLVEVSVKGSQLLLAIRTHKRAIVELAVDPSGERLAALGEDGVLLLLKLKSGAPKDEATDSYTYAGVRNCSERSWEAEPLGFIKASEPLMHLAWEHPLLLLGVAADAALIILDGLQVLSEEPAQRAAAEDGGANLGNGTIVGEGAGVTSESDDLEKVQEPTSESSGQIGDEGTPEEGSASDEEAAQCPPKASRVPRKDPLDLTGILSFRRIDVKVSTAGLRGARSEGQNDREEEDLSGTESESEVVADSKVRVFNTNEYKTKRSSSYECVESRTAAESKARHSIASTVDQQTRHRVEVTAAAHITALTTAKLVACPNNPDKPTWNANDNGLSNASTPRIVDKMLIASRFFLLFSGTSKMRNAIWCFSLERLLEAGTPQHPPNPQIRTLLAHPMVLLSKVLQQLSPRHSETSRAECQGPYLTKLVAVFDERLLIAGTSDGRVLLFPADTPQACVVTRVFDCHTGSITSILARPIGCSGRWALNAAAQSGTWWRCEFELADILSRCQKSQEAEQDAQKAEAAQAKAEHSQAQHFRCFESNQQQSGKYEQQQQFLRRLLQSDMAIENAQVAVDTGFPASSITRKKAKELEPPCPNLVRIDELMEVEANIFGVLETNRDSALPDESEPSATADMAADIIDNTEPTIMEQHRLRKDQKDDSVMNAAEHQESRQLQDLSNRYKARFEAESARYLEVVEQEIQNARDQHQILISDLTKLLGGVLEGVAVSSIGDGLHISSFPTDQSSIDVQTLQAIKEDQCGSREADDMEALFEEARTQELKRLLMPERAPHPEDPDSVRRHTIESTSYTYANPETKQKTGVCCGPKGFIQPMQQAEIRSKTDARRQHVQAMDELLKAKPQEGLTDPQSDSCIAETIKSLGAYKLTASGTLTECSLNFLEGRRKELSNSGALYETDATRAEMAQLETTLGEVHRFPDDFTVSFEHLRQIASLSGIGVQACSVGEEPHACNASVGHLRTSNPLYTGGVCEKGLELKTRFMDILNSLRKCELEQSRVACRVFAFQESVKCCQQHLEKSDSCGPLPSEIMDRAKLQSLELHAQASRFLDAISSGISQFDQEVRWLLEERTSVQQELLLARLNQLEQYRELTIIESMEPRRSRLQQDFSDTRKECKEIEDRLKAIETCMTEKKQGIESCHVTPKVVSPSLNLRSAEGEENDLETEIDETERVQQDSESIEDICPVGCDMAVYEAILELRDQKMANAAALTLHQRELDDLKKEYGKVQALQRQQACRYSSAEAAIHKFLRELQGSLNDVITTAPLRASQSTQRLESLEAAFKEVERVRFGDSLTLEQVEAAAKAAEKAELQGCNEPLKPVFERDVELLSDKRARLRQQQQTKAKLEQQRQGIIKRHTNLLHRFALARESTVMLSQQLKEKKYLRVHTWTPQYFGPKTPQRSAETALSLKKERSDYKVNAGTTPVEAAEGGMTTVSAFGSPDIVEISPTARLGRPHKA
ncbi:wd domain-containing protein [Cyclospora cayetanensis]|uniref:Wd domain-containing protein n=1 Tax=Cyclospora cayetanensis TaxID=88456 RepID=A0A1D3D7Q8_9EIME|nr:wd domain-containing protein [Cyclospora cayetanensis]